MLSEIIKCFKKHKSVDWIGNEDSFLQWLGCVKGAFLNWHRYSHKGKVYIEVFPFYLVSMRNKWMTMWPTNKFYVITLWMRIPHWERKCISAQSKQTIQTTRRKSQRQKFSEEKGKLIEKRLICHFIYMHNSINTVDWVTLLLYQTFIATPLDFFLYHEYKCICIYWRV